VEKKQLFCNPIFLGFANVLFGAQGVVDPNAPIRRKERGGKN